MIETTLTYLSKIQISTLIYAAFAASFLLNPSWQLLAGLSLTGLLFGYITYLIKKQEKIEKPLLKVFDQKLNQMESEIKKMNMRQGVNLGEAGRQRRF